MKTELKCSEGRLGVVELWHNGGKIGEVVGSDGPGVRVITGHYMQIATVGEEAHLKTVEIKILR